MFVQTVVVSLLALLLGLVLCFAGFRFFVLLLPLWAFFAGFLVTSQAIQELFGDGFLATTSSWVFGFVIGIACALVAHYFFYGAVVVLAASVGYELGVGIMGGVGASSGSLLFVVGVVVAVATAAAAIVLNAPRAVVVVLTAEAGASLILTGVLLAVGQISLATLSWGLVGGLILASWLWFVVFVVLWAGGIAAQLLLPERYALVPYGQPRPPSTRV